MHNPHPANKPALSGVTVGEALEAILAQFEPLPVIEVPLADALGMVLARDVASDMDIPPFDNSSMDGYAVRAADTLGATNDHPASLRVTGYLPAGGAPSPGDMVEPGTAFRIMTGAPIPPGADAVVRFEDTSEGHTTLAPRALSDQQPGEVLIYTGVRAGVNVRSAGGDIHRNDIVLRAGTTIRPGEIGVLASVGMALVPVHRRPRVAVLATGDELVGVDEMPGPGQIRNTNSYAITAQLLSWGAEAFDLGVARDNRQSLTAKLDEALALEPDLLVTSAGVSVGDYDIVKQVLMERGTLNMWRVRIKPGKPLAFGRLNGNASAGDLRVADRRASVPFLGLPGNPVSSMVTMELFGRPAILKMLGKQNLHRLRVSARVVERIESSPGRENYIRGIVSPEGGEFTARTTGAQGSEMLTSMSKANALLVVGENTPYIEAGDFVQAIMLNEP
ncbi:MAG TPA: gephyrin-like molybdotransferase Glp [Chloroflexia bacterium]|nr:gephyrin-like molybdotransferase Glp [Chloroflexia bacterium]